MITNLSLQLSHWYQSLAHLTLGSLLKSSEVMVCQVHKIPAELNKVDGSILCSRIYMFINIVWSKEELPEKWKESYRICV